MKKWFLFLALTLPTLARPLTSAEIQAFEAYAEKSRQAWGTPGMAVALIADNQVVYTHGFGTRELKGLPVTEETIFQVGSVSKSFTASLVALQVDAGRLSWTDKVVDRVTGFRMFDPWVTREFTLEDTMAQRSGQPAYATDALAFLGADRKKIIQALSEVAPVSSFRSKFAYVNNLWLVAAGAVEQITSRTWEQAIATDIFLPLAMASSSSDARSYYSSPNHATPYQGRRTALQALKQDWPYANWVYTYGPAGGINSNVCDMAAYVRMQLGAIPLIGSDNLRVMHSPHILISDAPKSKPENIAQAGTMSYCLGWIRQELSPVPLIWHNGATSGSKSVVGFCPDTGMGIVVLSNYSATQLPEALMLRYYDLYHDRAEYDYSQVFLDHQPQPSTRPLEIKAARQPAPYALYCGTYVHEVYGQAVVKQRGSDLLVHIGKTVDLILNPVDADRFTYVDPLDAGDAPGVATFERDDAGNFYKLHLQLFKDIQDGSFLRK